MLFVRVVLNTTPQFPMPFRGLHCIQDVRLIVFPQRCLTVYIEVATWSYKISYIVPVN